MPSAGTGGTGQGGAAGGQAGSGTAGAGGQSAGGTASGGAGGANTGGIAGSGGTSATGGSGASGPGGQAGSGASGQGGSGTAGSGVAGSGVAGSGVAGQGGSGAEGGMAGAGGEAGGDPGGAAGDAGQGGGGGGPAPDEDGDGWSVLDGDCCDTPGSCPSPAEVNPGAFEVSGNGVDDNCDGLIDAGDVLSSCDEKLSAELSSATTAAQGFGICALTSDDAALPERRWGLLEAALLRADGTPLQDLRAASLRATFGALAVASEGSRLLVLSTGIASDSTQDNPGPNGGAPEGTNVSSAHEPVSSVSLTKPGGAWSLSDWFAAEHLPLKPASSLPLLGGCPGQSSENASDSVVLALRLRVPTNARSFSFRTRFLSAEYPEFVCTSYSDQFVALLRGPGAAPETPPDGNLLIYTDEQQAPWPVSVNLALTPQFSVCEPEAENPACWKSKVHPQACGEGTAPLQGTGFETPKTKPCAIGGATSWFRVTGGVIPGQEIELRIALWDVGDALFDSVALLDGFRWSTESASPGATPEVP